MGKIWAGDEEVRQGFIPAHGLVELWECVTRRRLDLVRSKLRGCTAGCFDALMAATRASRKEVTWVSVKSIADCDFGEICVFQGKPQAGETMRGW